MVRTKLASAVLAFTALQSGWVAALGLGELSLDSALNQPFRASIPLSDVGNLSAEQIRVNLADTQAFENAGVDRSQFLSALKFDVQLESSGRGRIVVSSQDMVVEPYLDFIIEARWPNGRLLREYTVLLDLPTFNQAPPRSVAAPTTSAAAAGVEPRAAGPVMRSVTPPPALQPRPDSEQQSLPPSERPNSYRIQHHDTMWKLAVKLKPSPYVSTEQTMLALLEKNPNAFIAGNVNRIKSGYVLQLPSEAEAKAISHQQAQQEIQRQDDQWRGKVAPKKSSAAPSAAAPQLTSASEASSDLAAGPAAAKFSISSAGDGDADAAGESAQLRESLREAEEEAEKAKLESSAMQQRVVAMEQQIATLKSLIQLKNNQLAALQAGEQAPSADAKEQALTEQLQAAQESLANTPDMAETDGAAAGEGADAVTPQPAAAAEVDVAQDALAKENAKPPQAAQPPAVSAPAANQGSWLSNRLIWLLGAVLAILTLLVLWLRQRTQGREEAEDLSGFEDELAPLPAGAVVLADEDDHNQIAAEEEGDTPEALADEDVFAAVAGLEDDSFDSPEAPAAEADVQPQMGDPAAEADIYAAYGRYDQAESLLSNAIARDPDDTNLRVKLIDIYLETRNREAFDRAYAELEATGDADAVARVKESMSALEGVSDWLRADNTDDVVLPDTTGLSDEFELDDEVLADGDETAPLDQGGLGAVEMVFDDAVTEPVAEEATFDLEDIDSPGLADEELESGGLAEATDALGFAVDDAVAESAEAPLSNDAQALASLDDDLSDLDFDFELDEPATTAETEFAPQAVSGGDVAGADPGAFDDAVDDLEEIGGVNDLLAAADAEADGELNLEMPSAEAFEVGDDLMSGDALSGDALLSDALSGDALSDDIPLEAAGEDELSLALDDDLDLGSFDSPAPTGDAAVGGDEPMAFEVDLGSADFAQPDSLANTTGTDAADTAPGFDAAPVEEPAMDLQDIVFDEFDADLGEGADDYAMLADDDQVSTKLGLARAYVDMGDNEGARDILEEVLQEGSDAQQQEAKALLDQM